MKQIKLFFSFINWVTRKIPLLLGFLSAIVLYTITVGYRFNDWLPLIVFSGLHIVVLVLHFFDYLRWRKNNPEEL
jgi:hypothetical protein